MKRFFLQVLVHSWCVRLCFFWLCCYIIIILCVCVHISMAQDIEVYGDLGNLLKFHCASVILLRLKILNQYQLLSNSNECVANICYV